MTIFTICIRCVKTWYSVPLYGYEGKDLLIQSGDYITVRQQEKCARFNPALFSGRPEYRIGGGMESFRTHDKFYLKENYKTEPEEYYEMVQREMENIPGAISRKPGKHKGAGNGSWKQRIVPVCRGFLY